MEGGQVEEAGEEGPAQDPGLAGGAAEAAGTTFPGRRRAVPSLPAAPAARVWECASECLLPAAAAAAG